MGGCFCIPGELSLSWGPVSFLGWGPGLWLDRHDLFSDSSGVYWVGEAALPKAGRCLCLLAPWPPPVRLLFWLGRKGVKPGKHGLLLKRGFERLWKEWCPWLPLLGCDYSLLPFPPKIP